MTSLSQNNIPTILVVFGATGDLMVKKIIPSLWYLFLQGRLPNQLSIIAFSRRVFADNEFYAFVKKTVLARGGEIKEEEFSRFFTLFSYQAGAFEDKEAFHYLAKYISKTEASWGVCANKLFYLAVPPPSYEAIFKNLTAVKLNLPCGGDLGWSRILIEKPFGIDITSAQKLQSLLSSYFKEEQIYRIDHYLAKEIIQGIENFRFSNNLFENTWDNTTIDRIDIRLFETIGAEGRGNFYDSIGALRDVGQNHLLMMLAVITMEYPQEREADFVRKNRASILEKLLPWTKELIRKNTFRGQYRGYKDIEGVLPNSKTETYFALKTELLSPRWRGIPIFLEAGKKVTTQARKEIILTLKHPAVCLLCETGHHKPNRIIFRFEPNDEVVIHFWTKKPGFEEIIEERTFSFFLYEKETKVQYVEEYAKILHAAILGNQTLFVSHEEVEALWKFIDPIEEGWRHAIVPLVEYEPGVSPLPALLARVPESGREMNMSYLSPIGIVGLGKMGANIARRLIGKGWKVYGYNMTPEKTKMLEQEGLRGVFSLKELVKTLAPPRIIWLMVPAGRPVDEVIFGKGGLAQLLDKGDSIVDGGNSFYKDSITRYGKLKKRGIHFIDAGVSGGPSGALNGPSLMIGGEGEVFEKIQSLFSDLAIPNGYQFFEGAGNGHFVKMVHNGIEYGMMQALAEGFTLMKTYPAKLDLIRVADVYNHRSVIESRLVEWLKNAFELYGQDLRKISGSVDSTGEGEWTVKTAKEFNVPTPVIKNSFDFRMASVKKPSYTGKILSALRNQFGGHDVKIQNSK